ncbi:MAG: glycolate oxidase subunit GlcE [Burkholderiales bacterium]
MSATDSTPALQDAIRSAAASGTRLAIVGGGSKAFYGHADGAATSLSVIGHAGIVDYEPTELVVTARAGTPLVVLEETLAKEGQMIAFEPPHFGGGATLGGAIAAGLAGPRRAASNAYYGSVRDFVLGATIIDGRAEVLKFGGRVMKNVAGYDVARLIAGSMGTLGLILEVSLKVLPRPVAALTLKLHERDAARAIERLNAWGGRPLPITASAWNDGDLGLRLEGARAAVQSAAATLGGEPVAAADADALWRGLRDQTDPFFTGPEALWRVSVPSTAVPLALDGRTLIEWGGALRWIKTDAPAALVRQAALRAGGHATLFRESPASPKAAVPVFTPLVGPLARIHRELKAAFDPHGILNRGRLYPEF